MYRSCYGKTMANVRMQIKVEFADTQETCDTCANDSTFKRRHIIDNNLVGVEKFQNKAKLTERIFAGVAS